MNNASKTRHLSQHTSYFLSAMLLCLAVVGYRQGVLCCVRGPLWIPGFSMRCVLWLFPASCALLWLFPASCVLLYSVVVYCHPCYACVTNILMHHVSHPIIKIPIHHAGQSLPLPLPLPLHFLIFSY